jgi:4-alpha-glucanotransferase
MLPLAVSGPFGCPYSSPASGIGEPSLISLDDLVTADLLTEAELPAAPPLPDHPIDFGAVTVTKRPPLELAACRLLASPNHPWARSLAIFRAAQPDGPSPALFRVLHRARDGAPWWTWESALGSALPDALVRARLEHSSALAVEETLAFFFERQWSALRGRANELGIAVVGDLPIYVAADSADVWAHPELFELSLEGRPLRVAGVPPDTLAPSGQRWGNPLYNWEAHAAESYAWWCKRVAQADRDFDLIRLDHFRGFASYYAIDADSPDGRAGVWLPGPGRALFAAIEADLGRVPFIAEDLGFITGDVDALRIACGLPSMRVLQFGLDGTADNPHVAANIPEDAVVYTGTHDNATARGWLNSASPAVRERALALLDCAAADFVDRLVNVALESPASWAFLPVQDLLDLGDEARMNVPGTVFGNWDWRLSPGDLSDSLAAKLADWLGAAERSS